VPVFLVISVVFWALASMAASSTDTTTTTSTTTTTKTISSDSYAIDIDEVAGSSSDRGRSANYLSKIQIGLRIMPS
jgi:uncharacterized membrane protein